MEELSAGQASTLVRWVDMKIGWWLHGGKGRAWGRHRPWSGGRSIAMGVKAAEGCGAIEGREGEREDGGAERGASIDAGQV